MSWLAEALKKCELTDPVRGYLMGRGAKESTIEASGFCTWQRLDESPPDEKFCNMAGKHGEYMEGYLVTPVFAPSGRLIGMEARNIHQKRIMDYRLPEARWNPFFLGMKTAMPKVWAGGDVWIGEGLFDICPLEWAIPETDAVLASVRAQLSKAHVEFLRRFCKGWVHMVYDQDESGRAGMFGKVDEQGKQRWGAISLLERVGLRSRAVTYSGGNDPGEIWDNGGVAAVRRAFG